MSLSDVIRNIAKTVTDKEKAKELPLMVVQGTLSAAGQALLLVDRMKNSIKGLGGKDKADEADSRPDADEQAAVPAAEDRPARREPVIFAPRPSAAPEPNGAAKDKPEPVIFSPAAKPAAPEPVAAEPVAAAPEPVVRPAETKAPEAPLEAAAKATAKAATEQATEQATEPTTGQATGTDAEGLAKDLAEEPVTTAKAAVKAKPPAKPRASAAKPKGETRRKAPAKPKAATPAAEAGARPEATPGTPAGAAGLVEPLPGYDDLTVASLRARMRGKSAEQISALLSYEQATAGRPEVVRMFENRLAKLQAGE
ncbi:hypothetical protein ACGF0J_17635 [Nonomuraea sp. NPDC047897]|uniref:hypothetical protein n=1 Tax=Nonomuraea sp. NPDC047897 TaxID=3364346 RepID=UPI0037194246